MVLSGILLIPSSSFRSALNIQTGSNGSVEIERLTDVVVADFAQANRWYSKGRRARSTSWTSVNEASSRSHWFVFKLFPVFFVLMD